MLTATEVRNAKPAETPRKLWDGGGLFLLVHNNGGKYWRFKCKYGGKEKLLALGVYPDVSLAEAREKRDEARKLVGRGIDPSAHRKEVQRTAAAAAANSFEAIALEWLEKNRTVWTTRYAMGVERRLRNDLFPTLGSRPITQITVPELLAVLRKMEARGVRETTHRARQHCSDIMRYAIATGRAERDIAADVKGALHPRRKGHHAAITKPADIGALLRAIKGYEGSFITKQALLLAPLVFLRPGELRRAEWSEFDLDKGVWNIPQEKMKMGNEGGHNVPLSRQAVALLRELKPVTGGGRFVFPNARTRDTPMSGTTFNAALRRMGVNTKTEMTAHGFRAMARTILDEVLEVRPAIIEAQLAHAVKDSLGRAYNRTAHLPQRRKMMQRWADYLDGLERQTAT
jgi:integrase